MADITVQVSSPGLSVWGSNTWGSSSWSNISSTSSIVGQVDAFNNEGWGRDRWGKLSWGVAYENQTIEQTGFSLSSNIGSVSITSEINLGWGRLTWGENAWGAGGDVVLQGQELISASGSVTTQAGASSQPLGIDASISVGQATLRLDVDVLLTGTSAISTVGSASTNAEATTDTTGSSVSTTAGSVTVDARIETGWGRGTWGNRAWGDAYSALAQGQELTSAQGTVIPRADVTVTAASQQLLTLTQGQESIIIDADIFVFVSEHTLVTETGTTSETGTATVNVTNSAPSVPFKAYGNAALSTSQAKFGVSSLYVTNTSGSAIQSDNVINLGSYTNYTLEFWFYPQDISGFYTLFDGRNTFLNNAPAITQNGNDISFVYGTFVGIFASNVLTSANQWYHVAVTKNGSTYEMYVDGVSAGTYTNAGSLSAKLTIGSYNTRNTLNFNGYIDEFRLSTVRRYTANFTPPTSAFTNDSDTLSLLHLDGANGSTTIESADNTLFPGTFSLGQAVGGTNRQVDVTGIQASLTLGTFTLVQSTNEPVTGQAMTLGLGTPVEIPDQIVGVTGFSLTSAIGSVSAVGAAVVLPTGISLTSSIGTTNITAWAEINLGVNNVWTEADLGVNNVWTEVDLAA